MTANSDAPQPEWTIESGNGWVTATKTLPHVTVLSDTRSCHIHYWQDDDTMDAQGFGVADLVCHGCSTALRVLYPSLTIVQAMTEPFRYVREAFAHDHRKCTAIANEVLCPPHYAIAETRDLR